MTPCWGAHSLRRWWWRGIGIWLHMAASSACSAMPPAGTSSKAFRSQLRRPWLLVRHCARAVRHAQMPTTCPPLWSWAMHTAGPPTRRCHGVPEGNGQWERCHAWSVFLRGMVIEKDAMAWCSWREWSLRIKQQTDWASSVDFGTDRSQRGIEVKNGEPKLWQGFLVGVWKQIHQLMILKCHHWKHVAAAPETILDVSCLWRSCVTATKQLMIVSQTLMPGSVFSPR